MRVIRVSRQRQLPDESLNGANPRISAGFIVETPARAASPSPLQEEDAIEEAPVSRHKTEQTTRSVDMGDHISPARAKRMPGPPDNHRNPTTPPPARTRNLRAVSASNPHTLRHEGCG